MGCREGDKGFYLLINWKGEDEDFSLHNDT